MYTPVIELLIFSAINIFIYMNLWFILSVFYKRNDLADIAWGLGFINVVISILIYYFIKTPFSADDLLTLVPPNYLVITVLTVIWGLRLATHIYSRNKSKTEDFRYKKWREEWGKWFYIRSYLQVFLLQGVFMLLISMPAIVAARSYAPVTIYTYLGILIWCIGFIFEAGGDYQLTKFIANPENKNEIMKSGLWQYTRHPNYFGEVTQWWGIYIITLSISYFSVAIISPLVITFLILKVSGIPMLEKKYDNNMEFQNYKKETSAFFPWFKKKNNKLI